MLEMIGFFIAIFRAKKEYEVMRRIKMELKEKSDIDVRNDVSILILCKRRADWFFFIR